MKKKNKVPYSDESVKILMDKFAGGDPEQIKIWEKRAKVYKSRGHIPGAYFEDDYFEGQKLSKSEKIEMKKVSEVLELPGIYTLRILELAKVNRHQLLDWNRGKGQIYKHELIALKKQINELRVKIKSIIEPIQHREVFTDAQKKIFRRYYL